MPEERGLYPKMRVLDQLVYLARLHGLVRRTRERRRPRPSRSSASPIARSDRTESLSLGNQQRVQLAAALVHRPDVLVLDEPFSGLDPVGVDVLSGVLREQAAAGVPVVFSSHQLELVERLCESVVLIDRGRVVAAGRIADLRRGGRPAARAASRSPAPRPGGSTTLAGVRVLEPLPGGAIVELVDRASTEDDVLDAARRRARSGTSAWSRRASPTSSDGRCAMSDGAGADGPRRVADRRAARVRRAGPRPRVPDLDGRSRC